MAMATPGAAEDDAFGATGAGGLSPCHGLEPLEDQEVRQAENTKRRVFQRIEHASQHVGHEWGTGLDVVEAWVDVPVVHDAQRQSLEGAAQVSPGVGPGVGHQAVAELLRQEVDEGEVAETKAPPPLNA